MVIDISSLSDRTRWTVTLLPLPRRQTLAKALGLCGGHAVGTSEGTGYRSTPQWWRNGTPEALLVEGKKRVTAGHAHGLQIPGGWLKSNGGAGGAVGWRMDDTGRLVTLDLHDPQRFEWTSALGAGGGAFVGYGQHQAKQGTRAKDRALFWHADGTLVELAASDDVDAVANATDGATAAGRIGQKAVLWHVDGSEPIILGSDGKSSEVQGVRDGEQVGSSWQGLRGRAALWRGSAVSYVDLTPRKHASAGAMDCAGGLQVGYCCVKDAAGNGSSSMAMRAALWAGSAASHIDLQAIVPEPWNASAAWAIEITDQHVRIVGEATQFGVAHELTSREHHYMVKQMAVVWEARLL